MRLRHGLVWGLLGLLLLTAAQVPAAEDAVEARMRRDIFFLASDECEGRGPDTKGIDKAADYIAGQFKAAGLKPGGPEGGYFQPFTIKGTGKLEGGSLDLRGPLNQHIEMKADSDFAVMGFSGSGKVTASLVFAGYGISAPEVGYDDYKGVDVAGKVVLLVRRTPRYDRKEKEAPFGDEKDKDKYAGLEGKLTQAELHKAAAILLVNDASELLKGDKLIAFQTLASASTMGSIPVVQIRHDVADTLVRSGLGIGLRDLERDIDRDLQPRSAPVPGWKVTVEAKVKRSLIPVKNVVGVLEGAGPLAKETIVVGAHYDHLGFGSRSSRLKDPKIKAIHHGADDNASGTTALIELARRFGQMQDRQGRRLVFIAFSAEELGLLGSRYYCAKGPLFPLAETAAMVNLDMVGRLRPDPKSKQEKLLVEGVGTAKTFDALVEELNKKHNFQLSKKASGLGPSDHDSFCRQKIPVLFFWTGYHSDYHMPSDTADKINIAGMKKVAGLAEDLVGKLTTVTPRPEYVQVASSFSGSPSKGMPKLGVTPSYDDDQPGLLIDDVAEGGPAHKAGLKGGDRIIEIAGKSVTNVRTYMTLMAQQQRGQPVEITIRRDGQKRTVQATPQ